MLIHWALIEPFTIILWAPNSLGQYPEKRLFIRESQSVGTTFPPTALGTAFLSHTSLPLSDESHMTLNLFHGVGF